MTTTSSIPTSADLAKELSLTSRIATVNEMSIHYVIGGQGEPLVLLHGWPQTWYCWHHLIPLLIQHYTVIAPDLRGIGDSACPPSGYDKKTMADDIYQVVKQLGYTHIFLVGHDIGAMVAYAYAAQHPTEVQGLAVLDVLVPDQTFLNLHLLPVDAGWKWWFALHDVEGVAEKLVGDNVAYYLNNFYDHHDPSNNYDTSVITPQERAVYIHAYSQPESLHASFEWYRTFQQDIKDNEHFAQKKLPMPLLALAGVHSYAAMQVQYPKLATPVQVVEVQQAGHWLAEQQPQMVAQHLLTFFGTIASSES